MNFLSFLFPRIIEEVVSPINGKIKVIEQFGSRYISVGGLSQSGGLVKNLWEHGFKKVQSFPPQRDPASGGTKFKVQSCLVLGVGGGTVVGLINKYFPNSNIVGVEIDSSMIELGKKYFGLSELNNLKIIIGDAIEMIVNKKFDGSIHRTKHDLIIIDIYIGKEVPQKLADENFLKKLKSLVNEHGIIIFNRLRNRENKKEIDDFIKKLRNIFKKVWVEKPLVNYLIFCR